MTDTNTNTNTELRSVVVPVVPAMPPVQAPPAASTSTVSSWSASCATTTSSDSTDPPGLQHHDQPQQPEQPQVQPVRRRCKQKKPIKQKLTNREKCKKYREKRKQYIADLDRDMDQLRREVVQLCERQNALILTHQTRQVVHEPPLLQIAREYYRLFEFGMPRPNAQTCTRITRTQQVLFLQESMVANLGFGDLNGVDALVEQWSTYGEYHDALRFELEKLQLSGSKEAPIVVSNAALHAKFSRQTVEKVFPHVLANEPLVQKLIGRVVSYPCKNEFQFVVDPESGKWRVSRYDVQVGFVPALLKACGTLHEVIELIQDAQIVNDHILGEQTKEVVTPRATSCPQIVEVEENKMSIDYITT